MKKLLAGLMIGVVAASFAFDAEAQRRFGGGRTFGKQSPAVQQKQATPPAQSPQQGATQAAPAQQPAASAARPGAAPAAAARSPMRGALMGLAAGLGIAALASWLGFGEALTMFLTVAAGRPCADDGHRLRDAPHAPGPAAGLRRRRRPARTGHLLQRRL